MTLRSRERRYVGEWFEMARFPNRYAARQRGLSVLFWTASIQQTTHPVARTVSELLLVRNGKIAEHGDTSEAIAHRSAWKNETGTFGFLMEATASLSSDR